MNSFTARLNLTCAATSDLVKNRGTHQNAAAMIALRVDTRAYCDPRAALSTRVAVAEALEPIEPDCTVTSAKQENTRQQMAEQMINELSKRNQDCLVHALRHYLVFNAVNK